MENKTVRSILLVLVAVLLLAGTFALGFGAASVLPKTQSARHSAMTPARRLNRW